MLDYKYIEQLLERYWECQTTLVEETILRDFFAQEDVPVHLLKYRQLFIYESEEVKTDMLGEDFDERMMALINEETPVKARTISLSQRLRPLLRAAAVVAVFVCIGGAVEHAIDTPDNHYPTIATTPVVKEKAQMAATDTLGTTTIIQEMKPF